MPGSIPTGTLDKFTTFGDLLRYLRRRAGITQVELSIAVGYSDPQISRLEQNLRLPDIPTLEARFISPLCLEDEPKAVARLIELAATVRREDAPTPGLCPYKGLDYFDEADTDLFVGREVLTEKLLEEVLNLTSKEHAEHSRFFAIVGASGSGKSSLVRAGLVPALRWNKTCSTWPIQIFTPTAHPLESLASTLTRANGSIAATAKLMDDLAIERRTLSLYIRREIKTNPGSYFLLVIDQFEELFALCHSVEERSAFIDNLLTAADDVDGKVIVVITLRADFYAYCAGHLGLRQALAKHQEYIGAMSDEEMRRAIEEPARRGRWEFEPGIVDLILHDVGHEPGALPLLSHALLETWQRRHGRTLTLSGYTSAGGVRSAIAETAEAVFTDQLTHEQQAIARRIFLRLTELGDETATGDTRRRATLQELILKPEESDATQAVLKALADARLITTSEDSVQVAHEALIREWPTLRGWLEDNREGLRLHRHLTEASQEWLAAERQPDILFRGARLAQASEWANTHAEDLNAQEREFLAASVAASENEAAQREAARSRELEAAKKLADAERQRAEEGVKSAHRLRRRSILSTSIGALAVILAVFSVIAWQRSVANAAHLQSLNLANAAVQANNSGRGDLALALAMEAVKGNKPPVDALKALRAIASSPATRAILSDHNLSLRVVAISPDAKTAFSGSCSRMDDQGACIAGELVLWDLNVFKEIRRWSAHNGWVTAIAFSPDGLMIVSGADDGSLISWDLNGNKIGQYFGQLGGITDIAIVDSINGLLSSSSDGSLILWGLHSRKILQRYENSIIPITSIAVASSKMIAVSAQQDGSLRLWNLLDAQPMSLFEHQGSGINSVAISLDGDRILFTNQVVPDLSLRMIDSQSGEMIGQYKFNCIPGDIAPNPDFSSAYIACQKEIYQVDLGKMEAQRSYLESSAVIKAITISQDRTLGLSAMEDGSIRVWNLGEQLDYHIDVIPADKLSAIATTNNKYYLLVNDAQINGVEQPALWDLITHAPVRSYDGFSGGINPGAIAFSPNNRFIAVAGWSIDPAEPTSKSPTLAIWNYTLGGLRCRFTEFSAPARALAFSPDSQYLLAGSQDPSTGLGQLILLDVNDCRPLYKFATNMGVISIEFNADGTRAITGMSSNGQVILWDMLSKSEIRRYSFTNYGSYLPVAFGPDSQTIISSGPAGLIEMGVETGNFIQSFSGLSSVPTGLAISPDGKYIAASSMDGSIVLWDYISGEELHRLDTQLELNSVLFTSDGGTIYAAATEGKLIVWNINEKSLSELLDWIRINRYMRELTCLERQQYHVDPQCNP